MIHAACHPTADAQQNAESETTFGGFQRPTANFLYCPNQFFDICLKTNSRGMVRIVAYILRQTIGWLDKDGMPINQQIKVSYRDLIEKAGVSRGAIGPAIQRAVAMGFIECRIEGKSKTEGQTSQTAEYAIRWDEGGAYTISIEHFSGFFTGEGNRTSIPNSFFDQIICKESLAVSKVVGTVLRHTVGYTNQFGGRRTETPLSYSQIQRFTNTNDRKTLAAAIRTAIETGYIIRTQAGSFDSEAKQQKAASYAIRWLNHAVNENIGSKSPPANKRFKNPTSIGSKSPPDHRFKNPTSIEKTKTKNTLKQQLVAAESALAERELVKAGFAEDTAREFVDKRGAEVVLRQLKWIDSRKPKNRLGLLRKAIEEDWEEPESFKVKKKIAEARKRDAAKEQIKRSKDLKSNEQKRLRIERNNRLTEIWEVAPLEDRNRWIEAAVLAEPTAIMQNIIRRKGPESSKPHFQVLNELERELENRGVNVAKNSTR